MAKKQRQTQHVRTYLQKPTRKHNLEESGFHDVSLVTNHTELIQSLDPLQSIVQELRWGTCADDNTGRQLHAYVPAHLNQKPVLYRRKCLVSLRREEGKGGRG